VILRTRALLNLEILTTQLSANRMFFFLSKQVLELLFQHRRLVARRFFAYSSSLCDSSKQAYVPIIRFRGSSDFPVSATVYRWFDGVFAFASAQQVQTFSCQRLFDSKQGGSADPLAREAPDQLVKLRLLGTRSDSQAGQARYILEQLRKDFFCSGAVHG